MAGGLASRGDCNCKGVNTGKLVIMNVDLQFNSTRGGRRFEEEEEEEGKRTREVGMLIFFSKECKIWDSCWLV